MLATSTVAYAVLISRNWEAITKGDGAALVSRWKPWLFDKSGVVLATAQVRGLWPVTVAQSTLQLRVNAWEWTYGHLTEKHR
jgi:hypothetical protein